MAVVYRHHCYELVHWQSGVVLLVHWVSDSSRMVCMDSIVGDMGAAADHHLPNDSVPSEFAKVA